MASTQQGVAAGAVAKPKRERKPKVWAEGFVTPGDVKETAVQAVAAAASAQARQSGKQARHSSLARALYVVSAEVIDATRLQVVVELDGQRYSGVVERSGLPAGTGVVHPAPVEGEPIVLAKGENPNNLCTLCNQTLSRPAVFGVSDSKADRMVKVQISGNWSARIHLQCAVWAPEVHEDPLAEGFMANMAAAVRRGRALRCKLCKERGATLGCFQEGCQHVYHLNCAQQSGCTLIEHQYQVWCPQHRKRQHQVDPSLLYPS